MMRKRYLFLLRLTLFITDLFIVSISFLLTFLATQNTFTLTTKYFNYLTICCFLWVISAGICTLYAENTLKRIVDIYRRTINGFLLNSVLLAFYIAFTKDIFFSQYFFIIFYCFMCFGFIASRFIGTYLELYLKAKFKLGKAVGVLGIDKTTLKLAAFFEAHRMEYSFEGFLNETDGLSIDQKGHLNSSYTLGIQKAAEKGVEDLYITLNNDSMGQMSTLIQEAEKRCIRLKFVPDLAPSFTSPFQMQHLGEFSVITRRKEPLEEMHNRFKKRLVDIVISLLVITFILSWLYPLLALIIKMQSKGPVLFKQLRNGRNNEVFWCYKFRSMRVDHNNEGKQATKNDDRVTPIGRFMRQTSIDELPQFLNVLKGEMSVIGPRPHIVTHNEQYKLIVDHYMVRNFLKPGISGWAQVNGYRGETNEPYKMEKRVEHDIWYMENWATLLDIKIIFLTIYNLMKVDMNAY